MKLTVQQLANLCMHSWEVERSLGFHTTGPKVFRDHIVEMADKELLTTVESLCLLFRTVREIGLVELEVLMVAEDPLLMPRPDKNVPTEEEPKQPE